MPSDTERRASRRILMSLPVKVRYQGADELVEHRAVTRDVSFRGMYFLAPPQYEAGSSIEFILTLPREITLAGDVHIRCFAQVVRVEERESARGIAARIDRYEFLPGPM
ncbi:MAG TPA: PilZ domain-containing protein [Candidatus Acidoferrales bacterium]|jgi:hypothetical protein|nr:PilZ domain-containing protein [Candidatus Acidoferrales bacterium]